MEKKYAQTDKNKRNGPLTGYLHAAAMGVTNDTAKAKLKQSE